MTTIPTCYYSPSLLKLIDLYIDMGNTSFDNLSDAAKDDVVAECINILGEDSYSCIIDEDYIETALLFKKFIVSKEKDDSYALASLMNKNAKRYFKEPMNMLFEERCTAKRFDRNTEHGFMPFMDRVHGDVEWRRSA